ncbi:hypothetical protein [Nocardia pseudobrasiliensis]|uniref:Uncharacterized protein n=1 Tax=Nocardia pseudobrasiliensis TaxID=45979 RepID=A0A370HQ53_9NOCA|nr:hypothetical protein [Nocardia pseudobrasiliensis]RDI59024.1 hypothetical protein DFR76_12027 [Nocardia pseudobrasiliensis]
MRAKAIGFLDKDISGVQQPIFEKKIRDTAKCRHLDLARTLAPGPEVDNPIQRLLNAIRRLDAAAVITPRLAHLGGCENVVIAQYEVIESETGTVWRRGQFTTGTP